MNKKILIIKVQNSNEQHKSKTKVLIIDLGIATQLTFGKQGTHLENYPRGYSILNW